MRVAVYGIALNERQEVDGWEQATRDADYRMILDTGSTDGTDTHLERLGVIVNRATIRPWRFDDALNASLALLPDDIDVCFRLDMDERPRRDWRQAINRVWLDELGAVGFRYHWSKTKSYHDRRIHRRFGYRWTGPTHEVLIWRGQGPEPPTLNTEEIIVDHFAKGKPRPDDLPLLREGVRENPNDGQRLFNLGRELVNRGFLKEGAEVFQQYLTAHPSGSRAAWVWRHLANADDANTLYYLNQAQIAQQGPSNNLAYAEYYMRDGKWAECYTQCQYAFALMRSNPGALSWDDDERLHSAYVHDLASMAAFNLWDFEAAYGHAVEAVRRSPDDPALLAHLQMVRAKVSEGATLDPGMEVVRQPQMPVTIEVRKALPIDLQSVERVSVEEIAAGIEIEEVADD